MDAGNSALLRRAGNELKKCKLFQPEGVVLLAEVGDDDGEGGDTHLGRCRVPAPYLDAQFEAEIVDSEVNGYDEDIAQELSPTIKLGGRKRDVFLQPKAGEKGDWEDNAKGRNVRRDCLGKLKMENGKLKINQLMPYDVIINKEIKDPIEDEVSSSTSGIAEELFRKDITEGSIEKIYYFGYYLC